MSNSLLIHEYLERLSNLLRAEARSSGKNFHLQAVQLNVLHYLAICNRYSDTPLAVTEYLGLTRGTVSQTLIALQNKGLVSKETDKKDKRVVHLKLTRKGEKLVGNAVPAALLRAACERLSPEEQTKVVEAMKKLLLACQQANQMNSFGVCHTCRHNQCTADGGYFCGLTKEPLTSSDIVLICREHA